MHRQQNAYEAAAAAMRAEAAARRARPPVTTLRLVDGTLGWLSPRRDTCWAASVATCLQVPISEVPDARLRERQRAGESVEAIDASAWSEFAAWLARRRLRMVMHRKVPARRCRWVGVVAFRAAFISHTMVMSRDQVLFDPTQEPSLAALTNMMRAQDAAWRLPVQTFGPERVTYGYSFEAVR